MNHIEKLIARNIAAALIAAGKFVTVDYNEDEPGLSESSDLDAIIAACDEVDECWFLVDPHRDNEGTYKGFVRFIWGNGDEGRTCVSDYSVYLTEFVDPAVDGVDAELDRLIAEATAATKQVGTVDLTPTWAGVMPAMLAAITDGTPTGRDIAKAELTRLALIADALSETLTEIVRERVFGDGTADCEQRVIDLCIAAEKRFNIKRAA